MVKKPTYEALESKVKQLGKEGLESEAAKRAFENNERLLQNIFDGIQDGISVLDRNLTITQVNKWIEKTHYKDMPVVGKKCYEVYQKRKTICPWCLSVKALSTGKVHVEDVQVISDAGSSLWIELSAYPLTDEHDGVVGVIEHVKDVTKRKETEQALKESERRYRVLFENSRDGIVVVDSQGRFMEANTAYCRMLGYTFDELKFKADFYEITPPQWRDWERKEIWKKRLLQDGYSGIYEKKYIRKDGTVFPVELQSYAVFDEEGKPRYLCGTARDITKRKQA
jgi:PAS domain S-box-containing protein